MVEALRLQIQNNRDVILQEFRTFNGIRLIEPHGTFYALPDIRAFNNSSVEVSQLPASKSHGGDGAGQGVWHGRTYSPLVSQGSVKDVTEGVARIKWALDATSPNEIYIGDKKIDKGLDVVMNNLLNIKTPAEAIAQSRKADHNLSNIGVSNLRLAYWNLATEALYEEAVFRSEGVTSAGGPFIAHTGKHTARSANDKFVVRHTDSGEQHLVGRV